MNGRIESTEQEKHEQRERDMKRHAKGAFEVLWNSEVGRRHITGLLKLAAEEKESEKQQKG
jgi:hypothetical protein